MNQYAQIQKTDPPMPAASMHGWGNDPEIIDRCVTDAASVTLDPLYTGFTTTDSR